LSVQPPQGGAGAGGAAEQTQGARRENAGYSACKVCHAQSSQGGGTLVLLVLYSCCIHTVLYKVGARARLTGLTKAAHFNGQFAEVAAVVGDRLLVTLEGTGKQLKVKPENIIPAGGTSLDSVLGGSPRPGHTAEAHSLDILTDGLDSQFDSIFASLSPTNSSPRSPTGSYGQSSAANSPSSGLRKAAHFTFDGSPNALPHSPRGHSNAVQEFDEIFGQPTPVRGGANSSSSSSSSSRTLSEAWKVRCSMCLHRVGV
jgi:hypothetical protein